MYKKRSVETPLVINLNYVCNMNQDKYKQKLPAFYTGRNLNYEKTTLQR